MSQPRIMTVPNDETLVAFGTMNDIVYAIVREDSGLIYGIGRFLMKLWSGLGAWFA